MIPTIHLAFVDDWELRGDGSGNVEKLQVEPMRRLVDIFDKYGIRGSFNVEVMQQMAFRTVEDHHPELKRYADLWEEAVTETYSKGHDIQLHIHPQWKDAKYLDGKWELASDWSILNYSPADAAKMLNAGRELLEKLLRPVDPAYKCVSFRSGSWCIAPSSFILDLLVDMGIVFDMSIVAGVEYRTNRITLDYTKCDEPFLPYYPVMTDARRMSDKREPIVCVPTNHFYRTRRHLAKHHIKQAVQRARKGFGSGAPSLPTSGGDSYYSEWADVGHSSSVRKLYDKLVIPYAKGKHFISDIAQLDYQLMTEMLAAIRRRARATGQREVPIVLENHTKDITDFHDIERFVADVAVADDIKCVTLTEVAGGIKEGNFKIAKRVTRN